MKVNYDKIEWSNNKDFLNFIASFIDKDDWVLDVGCGTGIVNKNIKCEAKIEMDTDPRDFYVIDNDIRYGIIDYELVDKIIMRMVTHSMDTDDIYRSIKNCYNMLVDGGKLIYIEGVPPDESLRKDFEKIFSLKEKRQTLFPKDLVKFMGIFDKLNVYTFTVPQVSIKNWLKETHAENADKIYKLHEFSSKRFRAFYNLVETGDDILIDMKFCIVVGTK